MRVVSLFSGIGAHDLGLEWAGMTIVGQVENDEYCTKILQKHWPKVRRWKDISTVSANDIRRLKPDLITGGFPCQDISTAGKQRGIVDGVRSGLWREMWRLIREVRPPWVLIENVPALRVKGADSVISALEASTYTCWPLVVGAIHVGAPHERCRVWIVGYTEDPRRPNGGGTAEMKRRSPDLPTQVLIFWATPTAMDSTGRGYQVSKGKVFYCLPGLVHLWPTPTASLLQPAPWKDGVPWWKQSRSARNLEAIAQCFPTPTATEYGSNQGGAQGRVGQKRGSLSQVVRERISGLGKNRERLNPKWVAQLMGLPEDWL